MKTIIERLEEIESKMASMTASNVNCEGPELRNDITKMKYQVSQLCSFIGVRETEL